MDKPKKYEDLLMAALNFTEADLEANQAGALSARQVAALEQRRNWSFMGMIASIVVTALVFLIASVMQPGDDAIVVAILSTIPIAFAIWLAYTAYRYGKDVAERHSAAVEGRVELDIGGGQNSTNLAIKLENKKFRVNKRQFLTFKSGDPYRIYYAPRSKRVLSAEWLRDDAPFVDRPADRARLLTPDETPADAVMDDERARLIGDDGDLRDSAARS